jgi:hypothetical protein
MIVKITGKGTSFKGAGLYYLHDKGASTKGRVLFTLTENLATDNPNVAIAMMIKTATSQLEIKRRAGGSARGRKLEAPVYTYCLSWAPDEAPTRDQIIAAAKETLKTLGLADHEALLIAHNDEPHPHVHVIVNRVNPDTGIAAGLNKDRLKLSTWAQGYEEAQGKIRAPRRVENNKRRKNGEYAKDSGNDNSAGFHDWRRQRIDEDIARRRDTEQELSAAHRSQRQALFADKEDRVRAAKAKIREDHKPMWRMLFLNEKRERENLAFERRKTTKHLTKFLKTSGKGHFHAERQQSSGHLSKSFGNAVDGGRKRKELHEAHIKGRATFSARIAEKQRDALKAINDEYKRDLEALKALQQGQLDELAARHSAQSQDGARKVVSGEDRAEFLKDQLLGSFGKVAKDRVRAVPDFEAIAKDRPRPAREFREAAGKPDQEQRPAGRAAGGTAGGKAPEQFKVNADDLTRRDQKTPSRVRSSREQRALDKHREFKEQAKDATTEKTIDKGRERTRTPWDKRPKND